MIMNPTPEPTLKKSLDPTPKETSDINRERIINPSEKRRFRVSIIVLLLGFLLMAIEALCADSTKLHTFYILMTICQVCLILTALQFYLFALDLNEIQAQAQNLFRASLKSVELKLLPEDHVANMAILRRRMEKQNIDFWKIHFRILLEFHSLLWVVYVQIPLDNFFSSSGSSEDEYQIDD